MDRLSNFLTLATGPVLVGGLVIIVFSMGLYSWPWILGAVAVGTVLTWPAAYWISRVIKRRDPDWDETKVERVDGIVPDPKREEV